MSDNHKRYRSIKKAIRQMFPTELTGKAAKKLDVLAALISGIVGSKRTNYAQIASKVPDDTKPESRVKRYSRWVNDIEEDQEVYEMPFARELLVNLAESQEELVFAMDGSEVGRKCVALLVSVIYQGRALPLAWIVVKGSKGHFPEDAHIKLAAEVNELAPEGTPVVFLGDGEFDGTELQAKLEQYHWRYVFRTASNTILSKDGAECAYKDLPLRRGERWSIPDVSFTRKNYGPVTAIGWWRKGYKQPIYLVTNLNTLDEACQYYQKRFRIETFFSDQKSRGFHLHKSHLSDPKRVAHLMLAACLAYLWIVYLGAWAIRTGLWQIIHRKDRCDLSLFQLGFRTLDAIFDFHLPIPVSFTLSPYVTF